MRVVFTNWWLRSVVGLGFGAGAAYFITVIFNPGKGGMGLQIFGATAAALTLTAAIRAGRGSTVLATRTGVYYRSLFRTRRWDWPEIAKFEAIDGQVRGYVRRMLVLHDTAGKSWELSEFNTRRELKIVDGAASYLNAMIRGQGQGPSW